MPTDAAVLHANLSRSTPLAACAGRRQPRPAVAAAPAAPAGRSQEHIEELGLAVGETKTIPAKDIRNYSVADPAIIDVRVSPGRHDVPRRRPQGGLARRSSSSRTTARRSRASSTSRRARPRSSTASSSSSSRARRASAFAASAAASSSKAASRRSPSSSASPSSPRSTRARSRTSSGRLGLGRSPHPHPRRLLLRPVRQELVVRASASATRSPSAATSIGAFTDVTYDFLQQRASPARTATIVQNQPLPRLDIAANNGWAKVLKQSSIITSNGQEAVFNSGGEVNFRQFAFQSHLGRAEDHVRHERDRAAALRLDDARGGGAARRRRERAHRRRAQRRRPPGPQH